MYTWPPEKFTINTLTHYQKKKYNIFSTRNLFIVVIIYNIFKCCVYDNKIVTKMTTILLNVIYLSTKKICDE